MGGWLAGLGLNWGLTRRAHGCRLDLTCAAVRTIIITIIITSIIKLHTVKHNAGETDKCHIHLRLFSVYDWWWQWWMGAKAPPTADAHKHCRLIMSLSNRMRNHMQPMPPRRWNQGQSGAPLAYHTGYICLTRYYLHLGGTRCGNSVTP